MPRLLPPGSYGWSHAGKPGGHWLLTGGEIRKGSNPGLCICRLPIVCPDRVGILIVAACVVANECVRTLRWATFGER